MLTTLSVVNESTMNAHVLQVRTYVTCFHAS